MHAPDTYRFFDQRVRLNAPPSVRAAWNLLYGAMADPDLAPATREHRVDVAADGGLAVNGRMRDPGPGSIMARLQEVVQNDILTSVTSHLLWHGAVWRIDGRALLVVADSGCGKTTLSLRHQVCGGEVWSDEAGGWDLATGGLRAWPRAMAVRPDSLACLWMLRRAKHHSRSRPWRCWNGRSTRRTGRAKDGTRPSSRFPVATAGGSMPGGCSVRRGRSCRTRTVRPGGASGARRRCRPARSPPRCKALVPVTGGGTTGRAAGRISSVPRSCPHWPVRIGCLRYWPTP